jgi:E1A/CREB-binding protein
LDNWADPNELLKSVAFDMTEMVYKSSVRALGIINKMITGPFWRLIEKVGNVLDLNPHLVALQVKFKELASDASPLLRRETIFFVDIDLHKDEIFDSLFNNETNEPILELYTQMVLEMSCGGMLLILERQAKDQLPGGRYYEPSVTDQMRASTVPTTNTCPERDFAQLDVPMRLKPSALNIAYKAIIMWSNNKTSEWLNDMPSLKKSEILEDARRSAPQMMEAFKTG